MKSRSSFLPVAQQRERFEDGGGLIQFQDGLAQLMELRASQSPLVPFLELIQQPFEV